MNYSKLFEIQDKSGFFKDENTLLEIVGRSVKKLIGILDLELIDWKNPKIIFQSDGFSQVVGDTITVTVKEDSNLGCKKLTEMLLTHELTHYLTGKYWGAAPVILWEGLPIYLADNKIREEFFGFSYHQICKLLEDKSRLIDLSKFLLPHSYYGYRQDFRVDIQCGSFTGFLVENYAVSNVKKIIGKFEKPSSANPVMRINPLFTEHTGKDLKALEQDWISFLRNEVKSSEKVLEMFGSTEFRKELEISSYHCKFCYFPMNNSDDMICSKCGGDNSKEIVII